MFVEENRRTRRVVARLVRGESLRESLEALARDHAVTTAWVSAHGVVARASVEARIPMRPDAAIARTVEGPLELVSLTGDLATREGRMHLDACVVLAKHADHGFITVAGHLLDAEAEGVTVMLDCLDDLGLRREEERPTGLDGWRSAAAVRGTPSTDTPRTRGVAPSEPIVRSVRAAPDAEPRRAAAAAPAPEPRELAVPAGWAAVAAASAAPKESRPQHPGVGAIADPIDDAGGGSDEDEPMPVAGDWVDHRQFGLCRVDRALPDGELMIKLETGRRKEIRLDYLEVLPPRMDGARRIYPLRPRKRDA